jgi:ABC-type enterochelin transport system substrate-binding protein
MSNRVNLSISMSSRDRKKIEELLKSLPSVKIESREESLIEKGTGTQESLSKYFGMRDNSKKRLTATQIREQAWQRDTRKS